MPQIANFPPDHPVWGALLKNRQIPDTLPNPVALPHLSSSTLTMTVNPRQWIVEAYRLWLSPFEAHMTKNRATIVQRHAAQTKEAAAAGLPAPPALPTHLSAQTQLPATAPSDHHSTPHLAPPSIAIPPSPSAPQLAANDVIHTSGFAAGLPGSTPIPSIPLASTPGHFTFQQPSNITLSQLPTRSDSVVSSSNPFPVKVESSLPPTPAVPATPLPPKKRKRDKTLTKSSRDNSAPLTPVTATAPPLPPEKPSSPKRIRYRVEYRPLHYPPLSLGGYDQPHVSSTFMRNNLSQSVRSIHDLGVVDMDAILMGLRSRLPREVAYAITVLNMLSMPHPEERIPGLPLRHLSELYAELLDIIGEAAFGEAGTAAWAKVNLTGSTRPHAVANGHEAFVSHLCLEKLTYLELERLGLDLDYSLEGDESERYQRNEPDTNKRPDIVLAGLNLLKNLSLYDENQRQMGSAPALFDLLAAVSDSRLCRAPHLNGVKYDKSKPFTILELVRVRRESVAILTNVGQFCDLRAIESPSMVAIFRLISSFIGCGFEALTDKESAFGQIPRFAEDGPPPFILSLTRSLEAFCKVSERDANREVLSSVPSDELIDLFSALVKLLPLTRRHFEALYTMEDYLAYCELLAMALYSLVFLSPTPVRAKMRAFPGMQSIVRRIIYDASRRGANFSQNVFSVLARRLAEMLGVINGTVSVGGESNIVMGFSAGSGSGDGKGWTFANRVVEAGWLSMSTEEWQQLGVLPGMDASTLRELEGMWWDEAA